MQVVNILFTLLALFHLAYLGVMFGTRSETDDSLQVKVGTVEWASYIIKDKFAYVIQLESGKPKLMLQLLSQMVITSTSLLQKKKKLH